MKINSYIHTQSREPHTNRNMNERFGKNQWYLIFNGKWLIFSLLFKLC